MTSGLMCKKKKKHLIWHSPSAGEWGEKEREKEEEWKTEGAAERERGRI